jgi:hypothetical protein
MGDIVSTDKVRSYGTRGLAGLAGGTGLLVVGNVLGWVAHLAGGVPAFALGALFVFGGYRMIKKAAAKSDKTAGAAIIGTGLVIAAAPFFLPLISIAGVGLLIFGGYSVYKFFKGLKSRA